MNKDARTLDSSLTHGDDRKTTVDLATDTPDPPAQLIKFLSATHKGPIEQTDRNAETDEGEDEARSIDNPDTTREGAYAWGDDDFKYFGDRSAPLAVTPPDLPYKLVAPESKALPHGAAWAEGISPLSGSHRNLL